MVGCQRANGRASRRAPGAGLSTGSCFKVVVCTHLATARHGVALSAGRAGNGVAVLRAVMVLSAVAHGNGSGRAAHTYAWPCSVLVEAAGAQSACRGAGCSAQPCRQMHVTSVSHGFKLRMLHLHWPTAHLSRACTCACTRLPHLGRPARRPGRKRGSRQRRRGRSPALHARACH